MKIFMIAWIFNAMMTLIPTAWLKVKPGPIVPSDWVKAVIGLMAIVLNCLALGKAIWMFFLWAFS